MRVAKPESKGKSLLKVSTPGSDLVFQLYYETVEEESDASTDINDEVERKKS